MRKRDKKKKFYLNKKTVSALNLEDMNVIRAGGVTETILFMCCDKVSDIPLDCKPPDQTDQDTSKCYF